MELFWDGPVATQLLPMLSIFDMDRKVKAWPLIMFSFIRAKSVDFVLKRINRRSFFCFIREKSVEGLPPVEAP